MTDAPVAGVAERGRRPGAWVRLLAALAIRALVSPGLLRALLVVAWRFRARGWYRRFPFLPLPSRAYLAWRLYTAYGSETAVPPVGDVVRYARWAARRP